jgi:hypothetical protein
MKNRNKFHYIGGFAFAYTIGNATGVYDFYLWQKIIGSIIVGLILGMGMGVTYEFYKNVVFKNPIDETDIYRTAIGSLFGFGLSTLVPDLKVISVYLFIFCLILFLLDTIFAIIKKYKK